MGSLIHNCLCFYIPCMIPVHLSFWDSWGRSRSCWLQPDSPSCHLDSVCNTCWHSTQTVLGFSVECPFLLRLTLDTFQLNVFKVWNSSIRSVLRRVWIWIFGSKMAVLCIYPRGDAVHMWEDCMVCIADAVLFYGRPYHCNFGIHAAHDQSIPAEPETALVFFCLFRLYKEIKHLNLGKIPKKFPLTNTGFFFLWQ